MTVLGTQNYPKLSSRDTGIQASWIQRSHQVDDVSCYNSILLFNLVKPLRGANAWNWIKDIGVLCHFYDYANWHHSHCLYQTIWLNSISSIFETQTSLKVVHLFYSQKHSYFHIRTQPRRGNVNNVIVRNAFQVKSSCIFENHRWFRTWRCD